MKILAVDTSTRRQSVAVMEETTMLAHDGRDDCASHSGSLLPAIHALLQSVGGSLSDVEGLAVASGPGSFTGLRAGLATMIGLRLVTGLPLATVPTLEAMAWGQRPSDGRMSPPLCPMLAARANEVYWARFQWRDGALARVTDDRAGTVRDAAETIREPTVVFGDGWTRHRDAFTAALGSLVVPGVPETAGASAVQVGLAGLSMLRAGIVAGPRVAPHYVQPSEAERQWNDNTRRPPF